MATEEQTITAESEKTVKTHEAKSNWQSHCVSVTTEGKERSNPVLSKMISQVFIPLLITDDVEQVCLHSTTVSLLKIREIQKGWAWGEETDKNPGGLRRSQPRPWQGGLFLF